MRNISKGVYCLTSPSGKKYVGIAMGRGGFKERFRTYRNYQCKQQKHLYAALKFHGAENFKYEVVLETYDIDNAKRSEKYLIDVWNLQDREIGYNITSGGDGRVGAKHSQETKDKIRLSKLGIKASEETKMKRSNSMKGKNTWAKGRIMSKEEKVSRSESMKGINTWMTGKKASEETKRKISEAGIRRYSK